MAFSLSWTQAGTSVSLTYGALSLSSTHADSRYSPFLPAQLCFSPYLSVWLRLSFSMTETLVKCMWSLQRDLRFNNWNGSLCFSIQVNVVLSSFPFFFFSFFFFFLFFFSLSLFSFKSSTFDHLLWNSNFGFSGTMIF